jgi:TRAP-type C4-dicarboxylate transport system permease small subunit
VIRRASAGLALLAGAVLLATALLTTVSVTLRWLTGQPVKGDFELVSLGSGLAVLGFLAWATQQRANILVDSFTTWLPARVNAVLDGFWSLVWAAVALLIAERMWQGALDTFRSGTRTMGLLALPYWWAVAVGSACFALTGLIALLAAPRLARS